MRSMRTILALASGTADYKIQNSKFQIASGNQLLTPNSKLLIQQGTHRSVTITLNVSKISFTSYQNELFFTYSKYSFIFSCIITWI